MNRFMRLFFLLVALGVTLSKAQLPKGTKAVGFNIYLSTYDNDVNSQNNQKRWILGAVPSFDYFIKDNLSIGLAPSYTITKSTSSFMPTPQLNTFSTKSTLKDERYGLSFRITKYWFTMDQKLGIYISPGYTPSYYETTETYTIDNPALTDKQNTSTSVDTHWAHNAYLNVGLCYFLFPNFAVELNYNAANYRYQKSTQMFDITFSPNNIQYGFRYYFRRNK